LLTGKLGCQFLDCLELTDRIRTGYRDRVKELLLKEPGAIPNWHVSEIPQRVLSKDTLDLNRVLGNLISYETLTRLVRTKDKQLKLSL
jgi:hypothetical protein